MRKFFLSLNLLILSVVFCYAENSYYVGDDVSCLNVVQSSENQPYVFYVQDNCVKELLPSGEIKVLYESEGKIVSLNVETDLFYTFILINENIDNKFFLNGCLLNLSEDLFAPINVLKSINKIDSVKMISRIDSFIAFWLDEENLYLTTVEKNTYEVKTQLLSSNVSKFDFNSYGNKLYGYYLSKSDSYTDKAEANIFLLNDDTYYSLKYENFVFDLYINDSSITETFVGQYIALTENGYDILQAYFNDSLKVKKNKLTSLSEKIFKVVTPLGDISKFLLIYQKDEIVVIKIISDNVSLSEVMLYGVNNLFTVPYEDNNLLICFLDEDKHICSYRIDLERSFMKEFAYINDYAFDYIFISPNESDSNIVYGINNNQLVKNDFENPFNITKEFFNIDNMQKIDFTNPNFKFIFHLEDEYVFYCQNKIFNLKIGNEDLVVTDIKEIDISDYYNGIGFYFEIQGSRLNGKKIIR